MYANNSTLTFIITHLRYKSNWRCGPRSASPAGSRCWRQLWFPNTQCCGAESAGICGDDGAHAFYKRSEASEENRCMKLTHCTHSVARPFCRYSVMHRTSWSFSSSSWKTQHQSVNRPVTFNFAGQDFFIFVLHQRYNLVLHDYFKASPAGSFCNCSFNISICK